MNFRIYLKNFNGGEVETKYELLEECCVAFFHFLGPSVHKIEMYENLSYSHLKEEPVWRVVILARRDKENEAFRIVREFNIF